jgi:antitoxin component YwqK of YwqJK toxin-antitoxin module
MQKVIYLKEYKQKLIDHEKALKVNKSLIDEEANYEDIRFELECEWDKEFDHRNLGFVLRENSKLDLFYLNGKFCRYMDLKLIDGKEILREPSNETPTNKSIVVEFTGTYETYHEDGSIEISADFNNGLLHGRFIHFLSNFHKWREYNFIAGKKHGKATHFYPDGRINSLTYWHQDKRDGDVLRFTDEADQKVTTYSYKEGKLNEISK